MPSDLASEEEAIRDFVRSLGDQEVGRYHDIVGGRFKDPDTYAALNYGLVAGLHHMYLGRWLRAAAELLGFVSGVTLLFIPGVRVPGVVIIAVLLGLEARELLRCQSVVLTWNNQLAWKALEKVTGKQGLRDAYLKGTGASPRGRS